MVKGAQTITVPETITIATARPGIFTTNQQGTGQGAILDAQGRLVDSNAAVAVGDIVQVLRHGVGDDPAGGAFRAGGAWGGATGAGHGSGRATVDGKPAPVHFAGLAPGFVGLYQVNVQIPEGVTAGTFVPLVLFQQGVPSNSVTLVVK